tara:strand:+ start:19 stop:729 length:711 start_codon:yes stop_codon:yes gene_type:complete|eukprot:g4127.t1
MSEVPSDKFLSREKAYELEHKTGFSRKELLTFHKHYGACVDSLGRITEEDKAAFLKEMNLEDDEVTLQVMSSIQAVKKKKPGKVNRTKKGIRGENRPLHFEEYIQSLMFLRHGQGRLDLRTRYLYQQYSTSDKGLNREDIEKLLAENLKPEIMERPRAAIRLKTWVKRHFNLADLDKSGYVDYSEFDKIINSDHNFFKIEDIKVDMNSIAGSIYKRRKREEILAKLEKRLNFGPSK